MRFAAFTTVAASAGEATNAAEMLDNLRQQTVLAEELGFEAMWLGEHHFGPYGIGDLPNPILLGADLAARTSRIRIGQMANIAPWWHPIRLAEDLAILDNLTEGRIEVGFGRGSGPTRVPSFTPTRTRARTRRTGNCSGRPSRSCGRYGPMSTSPTREKTTASPPTTPFSPTHHIRLIRPGRMESG